MAELLQGLVKLAAAGVKLRQGRPAGVCKHASRAAAHFDRVAAAAGRAIWAGLDLGVLSRAASRLAAAAADIGPDAQASLTLPVWELVATEPTPP